MLQNLSDNNSILSQFVSEIRDIDLQKDRMRFRTNVERIGEIMAYEISKSLAFENKEIQTPLAKHQSIILVEQPVIASILRAGLPMHQGFLNYFDKADCAFLSAFRKHISETEFEIELGYLASPSIENRVLILIDPMLATGRSMFSAYQSFLKNGNPKKVFVASLISSQQGIEFIQQEMPEAHIFAAAIDPELNSYSYIVPGLGDAGDLSFGEKL